MTGEHPIMSHLISSHLVLNNTHLSLGNVLSNNVIKIFNYHMYTMQWGNTPLHRAATGGHLEAVKLLLDRGASVDAKNKVSKIGRAHV